LKAADCCCGNSAEHKATVACCWNMVPVAYEFWYRSL
jgi:hypothetical protein